ncbi:hypothetical protein NP089_23280, partial [Salmonella enterica]|nr:hypothetical protein [Salmonella enterica]
MKKHAIAVMMIAVFSESVYAESTLFIPDVSPDSVTTSLSVGVLNGKSRELVYGHCCKVSDEAAFCLIQRPYISKTLLT